MYATDYYGAVRSLRRGEVVNLEGLLLVKDEGKIAPGDIYVGERNTVNLFTARLVDLTLGCIFPVEPGYPFDISECIKVREAQTGPDADGFTLNGLIDDYPHLDLERPCTGPCCEPDAYPQPYRWQCQGDGCRANLRHPGECINCVQPGVTRTSAIAEPTRE